MCIRDSICSVQQTFMTNAFKFHSFHVVKDRTPYDHKDGIFEIKVKTDELKLKDILIGLVKNDECSDKF